MNRTTEKKKKAKKARPLRRAERLGGEIPKLAGRIALTMVAVIVLNLIFSAMQAIETAWLRRALSLAIAAGILLFFFAEGLSKGVKDASSSRQCEALEARGERVSRRDDAACYHPLKAMGAALCVFALPLAAAAYLGATAEEYTYVLQDLPAWLTSAYGARSDVMAPLGAYAVTQALTANDWIRVAVRLPLMVYINLFSDPLRMSAMIDRMSALFTMTYPAAFILGYLRAPAAAHKRALQNRRAKKAAVRRAEKKTLAEQLVGDQHGVHYGQQVRKEHKKKELV